MNKKIFALLLILALVVSMSIGLTACKDEEKTPEGSSVISFKPIKKADIKIGLICLHGEESTYDKNFIDAMKATVTSMGLTNSQLIIKTGIAETNACYETAADLVDQGCNIIFADSFGHQEFMLKAAKEFPTVRFCHATGTSAHTALQANFYNAFASIYEGRYLAGIAAGRKLNEMAVAANTAVDGKATGANAKIGYVGAYPYAEVVSGLTSFYLGVKSVCPEVKMDVKFTSSWYDEAAEKAAALALIQSGSKLISQHADSMGAPTACKENSIPNVTYNISTESSCSGSYIAGSKINWSPYFEHMINCTINGVTALGFDWVGTTDTGSVVDLELGAAAAAGTAEAIEVAKKAFADGTLKVFDVSTFTVGGKAITEYVADVDDLGDFAPDTNVIKTITVNGKTITYFAESEYRSAPYFDLRIDGITYLN